MNPVATQIARTALVVLPALLAAGCGPRQAATVQAATPKQAGGRAIVYLIDITGSYALPRQALGQAAGEIQRSARPGDVWFLRRIDGESYDERAAILTLRCPAADRERGNPFDTRVKARVLARQNAFTQLQGSAAAELRKYQPGRIRGTDIYGALAKAGELLEHAPPGAQKILVIATDFGDTRGRKGAVNLPGVKVVVGLFQGGSRPAVAQAMRRDWTARLKKYGASEVTFLDPSESLTGSLLGR